jgi:polysaccharide biosynthesis transport protein
MSTMTPARPVQRPSTAAPSRPSKPSMLTSSIDPIRVLRRHVFGIVLSAVIGGFLGGAAYVVLGHYAPLYRERVLFEVQPGLQQAGQIGVLDLGDDNTIFRIAQTETFMLTHPSVLEQALKNPNIKLTDWHKKFINPATGQFLSDQALDELVENISTSVVRGSNLFSVSWAANKDADVPLVLDAVARAYLNMREDRDKDVYNKNLKSFQRQLESTESTLSDLTAEMQKLIKDAGITTLDDVRFSGQAVKREQLSKELATLTSELSLASTNYELTSSKLQGTIEPSAADYFEAERDSAVQEQITQLQFLKTKQRELIVTRNPDNAMLTGLESTIRATEEQRDVKLKEIVNRNLQTKLKYFADDIEKAQKAMEAIEEEIDKTDRLLQDLAAKQAQYDALRMRREHLEARRTSDLKLIGEVELIRVRADASRVRQVQPALTPRERAFPKIEVIVPMGVLLLVGLTVGIVFLRELMDQRIKSVSDLAVLPGAHVLGGIPDLADDPTKTTAAELVVRKHPMSVLAESYRQITTSLLPMMDRSGHQTLLLVGVMPGAGTTTVVSNVAASAAASGRSVLVIDANFRRPRLGQAMGVSNDSTGLADVLSGAATLDQAVTETGDGISVMAAGTPANRVFDRLSNGTFESMVAELRGRFDLIIFDAPPVIVAGDAMVLANKVDSAVLVVRAHQEHRGLVARMMHRLADARCEMLGVLLNRPRGITGGYFKKNYATMAQYTASSS